MEDYGILFTNSLAKRFKRGCKNLMTLMNCGEEYQIAMATAGNLLMTRPYHIFHENPEHMPGLLEHYLIKMYKVTVKCPPRYQLKEAVLWDVFFMGVAFPMCIGVGWAADFQWASGGEPLWGICLFTGQEDMEMMLAVSSILIQYTRELEAVVKG